MSSKPNRSSLYLSSVIFNPDDDCELEMKNLVKFGKMISDYAKKYPKRVIKLEMTSDSCLERLPSLLPPNVYLDITD
jgi:hypothetical protein